MIEQIEGVLFAVKLGLFATHCASEDSRQVEERSFDVAPQMVLKPSCQLLRHCNVSLPLDKYSVRQPSGLQPAGPHFDATYLVFESHASRRVVSTLLPIRGMRLTISDSPFVFKVVFSS